MLLPLAHWDDDTDVDDGQELILAEPTSAEARAQAETDHVPSAPVRRLSLRKIKERDELVKGSVKKLKMTAKQIADFSKLWEHPFHDERDVWRRVKALKLDKKIKHAAAQSLHDEWTLRCFIKIARDACFNGFPMSEIAKEYRIGENSGIRADMRFRIGSRLFYLETQQSTLTYVGWKRKLGKYLAYRRRQGVKPFRVLVTFESEPELNTVVGYAKDLLKPYPNLTLFLFAYLPDLLGHYDTVTEDVWRSHRYEPLSLM